MPLFLTQAVPPNILLIIDSSESMQEGVDGRVALDRSDPACIAGPDMDADLCPAGARSPLSKASIVKGVGLELIDRYEGLVNMGLLSYQQNPASLNRNSFNTGGTVRWHLVERAIDVRFSTNPNPSWWQPGHTEPWDSNIKRFRERHPTRSDIWMFFNDAIPGYAWSTADSSTGVPDLDTNVTGFYCRRDTTSTSAVNSCVANPGFQHDPDFTRMTEFAGLQPDPGTLQDIQFPEIASNLWFDDRRQAWSVFLVDSQRQRGITSWGRRAVFTQLNQLEWRTTTSPGRGFLHQPIQTLDEQHAENIRKKLQPQSLDWDPNAMTDPDWPLIAAGLTPLEGTMQTARDYFLGAGSTASDTFGPNQGWHSNLPPIPESCGVNAAIWVTDGLPSVASDGTALGTNLPQALEQARLGIADFYSKTEETLGSPVNTYIVGFALPPGVENIQGMPPNPLDQLAAAGGTGQAFDAQDETSLLDALDDIFYTILSETNASAAAIATNSTRLDGDTMIYQARFNPETWSGDLLAFNVQPDGSVPETPLWNAADPNLIPEHDIRKIITSNPSLTGGRMFAWGDLEQQDREEHFDDNQYLLSYLRGDPSNELDNGGSFRNRDSALGDIINSDPTFLGRENFGYSRLPGAAGDSYQSFQDSKQTRPSVLFVGANDGMLHAFDAESGDELFAYVPYEVYPNLASLADPNYTHRYFVDGSPRVADAYINDDWRTLLIGSTGAGGRSVFVLDVTDPTPASIDGNSVLWEFTDAEMGYSIPQPTIARMADGHFWAIIPNGYESTGGTARLFLKRIHDGHVVEINTGNGPSNGLSTPIPVDTTGDRVVNYIYAGDLQGNLWRFNVSNSSISQWTSPSNQPRRLFEARDAFGKPQPITARPEVGRHPDGGFMVYFGTGTFFRTGDNIVDPNDVRHSFYGIRDEDGNNYTTLTRTNLVDQQILAETNQFGFDLRVVSDNPATSGTKGWYLDLVSPVAGFQGERVVSRAQLRHGRIIFVTLIPSADPCTFGGDSWLMELDAITGNRLTYSVYDLNQDGNFDSGDYVTVMIDGQEVQVPVSGLRPGVGIIRDPAIISAGSEREFKYVSGTSGDVGVITERGAGVDLGRQSWQQLR
ncbi:hypothetical protein B1C78_07510 [Thioalkalivibrio denitrificans]|uniref:PilY1 beta-propeller domain-containing protein n=2 Tax=Thioalkalivibrio denitrificans TaxID=108003 RepID=A0A1V3NJL8_9GAMM|nr:hypothetical protein B1C78_07510 [Thioalkalivibrio denitrificans]